RRLLLGLAPCSHLACPPIRFHRVGRPGASVKGTEILTGVLEATVRDPCRSGPGAKLVCGLIRPKKRSTSTGDPTQFSRLRGVPQRDMELVSQRVSRILDVDRQREASST